MRRRLVPNPPWVGQALEGLFGDIQRDVPPEWHPVLASDKPGAWQAREYGCGTYGCVVPTHDPNVVLKLTTDDTEAEFARDLSAKMPPHVCVSYRLVMTTDVVQQERDAPLFLLWRDAAEHVGNIRNVLGVPAAAYVQGQYRAGMAAYKAAGKPEKILRLAREWAARCQAMAVQTQVPEIQSLGAGLLKAWTDHGILFGDIHEGNLGLVNGWWVITDPGHIAVIDRGDEPPIADPGGLPDSADNVIFEGHPQGNGEVWVQWDDVSARLVSEARAWEYFQDALPDGFRPGSAPGDWVEYVVLRGVPSTGDTIRKHALYVVRPHELAARKLYGNEVDPARLQRVRDAWKWGTETAPQSLAPIAVYLDVHGAAIVDDGNHRLQVAAETDREVVVDFRPVVQSFRPRPDVIEIQNRILAALPKTIPSGRRNG
jgi:hypothetical protein